MKVIANNYRSYWYLVASLPLLWALGGDQFLLPVLLLVLFAKRVLVRGIVFRRSKSLAFWTWWLMFAIVSTLMIDESYRYVTWIRNFVTSFSGVCLAYLVFESHVSNSQVERFLLIIAGYAMLCSLTGFAGVLGFEDGYMSPVGRLLGVGNYGYLSDMFYKSFVQSEALWFSEGFIRPKGFMLYSNLLCGVVLVGAAIKLYLFMGGFRLRWYWRILLVLFWLVDGTVVVYTLSRSAWIGLAAAMATLLLLVRIGVATRISIAAVLLVIVTLASFLDVGAVMTKRFVEKGHSNAERGLNYTMIGEAVVRAPERFLLGYGTQRDVSEMDIPLGSHSTYLGILYKYGMIGLLLYLAGLLTTLWRLRRAIQHDHRTRLMGAVLMTSLVQIAVQGLFIEIDVDVVYMALWWILVGLSLAYSDNILRQLPVRRVA